jgi:hypothetical protein
MRRDAQGYSTDTEPSLRLMHVIYDIYELDVMASRRFKLNESAESMIHDA